MNRLIVAGVMYALSVLCAGSFAELDQEKMASPSESIAKSQPNIVYIALEDITPMMGCYGDTYAKTPIFDKLAEEGIRFTRAYSVGPVCSVSRAS